MPSLQDPIEMLIEKINNHNYAVHLRQYNKLKVNNEALWEAVATWRDDTQMRNHPQHVHMDEVTFGRSCHHVLTKLLEKVEAASKAKAAAAQAVDEWGEPIETAEVDMFDVFDDDDGDEDVFA